MPNLIRAPFRSTGSTFLALVATLLVGCQAGSSDISDPANGTIKHIQAASDPNMGTLSGHIYSDTGVPLTGLALINGNIQFTGSPVGEFNMRFFLDANREATMYFFADGFPPTSVQLTAAQLVSPYQLTVKSGGTYPNISVTYSKMIVDLAANKAQIAGTVKDANGAPITALALANGNYMFTGSPPGEFDLTVWLDSSKQVTHMVFADGFAPFSSVLDAYAPPPAVGTY